MDRRRCQTGKVETILQLQVVVIVVVVVVVIVQSASAQLTLSGWSWTAVCEPIHLGGGDKRRMANTQRD